MEWFYKEKQSLSFKWSDIVLVLLATAYPFTAQAETLQEYAAACDVAITQTVPQFTCSDGAILPIHNPYPDNGAQGHECSNVPYLDNAGCFQNSRFNVLYPTDPNNYNTEPVRIVALCRHKTRVGGDQLFEDIAVIQTNFDNGATCFYQQLGNDLDGDNVPRPNSFEGEAFWMPPDGGNNSVADQECASCHDSGPFLRTPYLTGVDAVNAAIRIRRLSGRAANLQPYWFPSTENTPDTIGYWNGRVFKVTLTGGDRPTDCSGACHLMGASSIDRNTGTSATFGPRATGAVVSDNYHAPVHGNNQAHWMKPNRAVPNDQDKTSSERIAACARAVDPDTVVGCTRTAWPH